MTQGCCTHPTENLNWFLMYKDGISKIGYAVYKTNNKRLLVMMACCNRADQTFRMEAGSKGGMGKQDRVLTLHLRLNPFFKPKLWFQKRGYFSQALDHRVVGRRHHLLQQLDREKNVERGEAELSNKWLRSCYRNFVFFRDMMLMGALELNGIVLFIVRSVCKQFGSCQCAFEIRF
jgi:hypothetical protein